MFRELFILIFLTNAFLYSSAQTDTLFWFAAPDLQQNHADRPILLRISSMGSPASVTISIPANPSFVPINVNIPANSSQSVDLTNWIDLIENAQYNTPSNKALLIKSTAFISCYYDIASAWNGDIFALKGFNGMGLKFTIPSQYFFSSAGSPSGYFSDFIIAATEDNTSVTITPKNDLIGHPANVPFIITLNKGQTYVCRSAADAPSSRYGGTVITSNKFIVVSINDDSMNYPGYGCADNAGDQVLPDNNAGTQFILVKGYFYGTSPDYYFVFATENQTEVKVDGIVVANLNAGEHYVGSLSNPSCYVETSNNAHMFHVSGFGCEIGGASIPSLLCTGSTSVSVTRATAQDFYVNIISPSTIVSNFTFNGLTNIVTAADFSAVPGTAGQWSFARKLISTVDLAPLASARIANSSGKFHLGIIHGDQTSTTRYGFFSDFSKTRFVLSPERQFCVSGNVNIQAQYNGGSNFVWTGPNNFSSSSSTLTINNITSNQFGVYTVSANAGPCGIVTETIFIDSFSIAADFSRTPSAVCLENNLFQFDNTTPTSGANVTSIQWNFGDNQLGINSPINHHYQTSGIYDVKMIAKFDNGCFDTAAAQVEVYDHPSSNITSSSPLTICAGNTILLTALTSAGSGALTTTQWLNNGAVLTNENGNTLLLDSTGIYQLALENSYGCKDTSMIQPVTVHPLPTGNVVSPSGNDFICRGESVLLSVMGNSGSTFQWFFDDPNDLLPGAPIAGAVFSTYETQIPGAYSLQMTTTTNPGCVAFATDTIELSILEKPQPDFEFSAYCSGIPILFQNNSDTIGSGPSVFTWNFGDQTGISNTYSPYHTFETGSDYQVSLTVTPIKCPSLDTTFDQMLQVEESRPGIRYPAINTLKNTNTPLQARTFADSYFWLPSNGLDNTATSNPNFNYDLEMDYTIVLKTDAGCITNDHQLVRIFESADIQVPKAFSPNADGHNDKLEFFLINIDKLYFFRVFNKWGQLVFETNDKQSFWNGRFKGNLQPSETYVWIAEGTDKQGAVINRRGQTILLR